MYFDGTRERFWDDEGDDARGRLYAMIVMEGVELRPSSGIVQLNWEVGCRKDGKRNRPDD